MLKAIFLDLDDTLLDTCQADEIAKSALRSKLEVLSLDKVQVDFFVDRYYRGIYRDLSPDYMNALLPVKDERTFRIDLIRLILKDLDIDSLDTLELNLLQDTFDQTRKDSFRFFDGLEDTLQNWREKYKLVVITNGPEYSQQSKVNAIRLQDYVDHIIIGGQEPEQKPEVSIFKKALSLAGVNAHEAVHIGDKLTIDVAGAKNAGIPSVWVSHGKKPEEGVLVVPDYIIKEPGDMASCIAGFEEA